MAKEKTAVTWRQEWRELTDYGRWFDETYEAACGTHTVVHNEIVVAVRISRDDSAVYTIGHDSNFCLFDLTAQAFKFQISLPESYLWSMAVNEEAAKAYIGGHDLNVVDIPTGTVTPTSVQGSGTPIVAFCVCHAVAAVSPAHHQLIWAALLCIRTAICWLYLRLRTQHKLSVCLMCVLALIPRSTRHRAASTLPHAELMCCVVLMTAV